MKIIKFPYILDGGDGGYYFIDSTNEEEAQKLIKFAEDMYCYMFEEPKLLDTVENESAIYDALSMTKYEPLGYNTKEELFAAYEAVPEFEDSHAYSLDGYEGAVIGITEDGSRFVYHYEKMIEIMTTRDKMSLDDAFEWYSYNVERSFPYFQPCPIIMRILED